MPRRPAAHAPSPEGAGFVAVGRVRGPRGVGGELKVDPLTDFPARFEPGSRLWASGRAYAVRRARSHRGVLLLELEGIDTREQADALRGALLQVPETKLSPLDEGQYYRFQIVGIEVVDEAGRPLGRVEEVLDTGANDVYVVRDASGELLLPAIDTVIKEVDLAGGRMVVEVLEGLERRPHKRPER